MAKIEANSLGKFYKAPSRVVLRKDIGRIDEHARDFIALSPFCVVGSCDAEGRSDVSPRGGAPGFVHVADEFTVLVPDRVGNNRLDTIRNILEGTGRIAIMFMIPGFDEVLRLNGPATLHDDPAMLDQFVEFGKRPITVIRVTTEELYFHCPKSIMRARLWDGGAKVARSSLPTLAEMVSDQLGYPRPDATSEMERAKRNLEEL
jgi:PPOX class probable FMN-dependent enzyme